MEIPFQDYNYMYEDSYGSSEQRRKPGVFSIFLWITLLLVFVSLIILGVVLCCCAKRTRPAPDSGVTTDSVDDHIGMSLRIIHKTY